MNSVSFFRKAWLYIKRKHYLNVCTSKIASLFNVPAQYLRKCGTVKLCDMEHFDKEQIGVKEPFPLFNQLSIYFIKTRNIWGLG